MLLRPPVPRPTRRPSAGARLRTRLAAPPHGRPALKVAELKLHIEQLLFPSYRMIKPSLLMSRTVTESGAIVAVALAVARPWVNGARQARQSSYGRNSAYGGAWHSSGYGPLRCRIADHNFEKKSLSWDFCSRCHLTIGETHKMQPTALRKIPADRYIQIGTAPLVPNACCSLSASTYVTSAGSLYGVASFRGVFPHPAASRKDLCVLQALHRRHSFAHYLE